MRLPLPRSLFARLMLIWMIGIALVLAVSLALFVGERERIGRSALFEGVAQEIASVADLLDNMSPPERERWIDDMGWEESMVRLAQVPTVAAYRGAGWEAAIARRLHAPAGLDAAATDSWIDRHLPPGGNLFSSLARRLPLARNNHEFLADAQALHDIRKDLLRDSQ